MALLGPAPERASAACALSVTYLGAPYVSMGAIDAAEVGGPAGLAEIPACDDTPFGGPPETTVPVKVSRIAGVAPRFGVALSGVSDSPQLMVAHARCFRTTTGAALSCLRLRTRRLITGPTLITAPSARGGDPIGVIVHIRDAKLRAQAVYGTGVVLQRQDGVLWRTTHVLSHPSTEGSHPVRLPAVAAGSYRIVKELRIGSRTTHVAAYIAIRAA